MNTILIIFCTLNYLTLCCGKPDHVPPEGCKSMFPHHGVNAQNVDGNMAPFHITLDRASYDKGDIITVRLIPTNGNTLNIDHFEGFMLQARPLDCMQELAVGRFFGHGAMSRPMMCHNSMMPKQNNTLTHNSETDKYSVQVNWQNMQGGHVYFQATVVTHFDTFWTNVNSEPLYDNGLSHNEFHGCPVRTKWGSKWGEEMSSSSPTVVYSSLFIAAILSIFSV